jgi:hypothetical protein
MKPYRVGVVVGLTVLLALTISAPAAEKGGDPRTQIAAAAGIKQFNQVEELRYTFNIQLPDRVVSRSWSWEPKKDRVTFKGTSDQGGTVTYDRASLGTASEQVKKLDPQFVNDNYWLIFPLRLYWDESAFVTAYKAPAGLPTGSGEARRIVVKYPGDEGYTPGDVYELFVDKSNRIVQWIYRKGGEPTPSRINVWGDYRKVGPLTLSLERKGAEGKFPRVWFTDVAVRLTGKPDWIPAK